MSRFRRPAAAILAVATFWPTLVFGQAPRAGVVTTLEGNVTVTRVALPQPQPLRFKDDVFVNDKVTTGDKAIARMLLGGKAVVTVRERSSLTITEVPGKSTIDLDAGKIALAIAKDKMKPGESIEIRTQNAVAGVRGTVVVAEVSRATAQVGGAAPTLTSSFYILRGQIDAIQINTATGQPVGPSVTVGTLQQFRATGISPAALTNIPPGQVAQIVQGLSSSKPQHSGGGDDAAKDNAVNESVALANAITGGGDQAITGGVIQPTPTPDSPKNTGGCPPFCRFPPPPPPPPPSGFSKVASGILIFGDRFERENVQSALTSLDRSVLLNTTTLPADLSSFGTIWHIGAFSPFTASEQTQLITALGQGRGIYLTGARPCCDALHASLT